MKQNDLNHVSNVAEYLPRLGTHTKNQNLNYWDKLILHMISVVAMETQAQK